MMYNHLNTAGLGGPSGTSQHDRFSRQLVVIKHVKQLLANNETQVRQVWELLSPGGLAHIVSLISHHPSLFILFLYPRVEGHIFFSSVERFFMKIIVRFSVGYV